jgi:hypothetical protein
MGRSPAKGGKDRNEAKSESIRRCGSIARRLARHCSGISSKSRRHSEDVTVDSPASMSILEEATVFAERPMMGVFNNLVIYDQHVKQNSLQSIVPDLATSWSWSEDGAELTFPFAARRDMARWQAVHGQGRSVHMGSADRQVE